MTTTTINPYLNFPGNAEEVFNFYKSIFGGEFTDLVRFGDMPMEGLDNLSEEDKNKIMHISLPVGTENILMACDVLESMGQIITEGNNFYISINTNSKEEAERLYNGLSSAGNVEMPLEDVPWGSYFGMCKDKYGIRWMVSFAYPKEETVEKTTESKYNN